MSFLLSLLGTLLGIFIAIVIICFIVYIKIRSTVGKQGMKEIKEAVKNQGSIQMQEYSKPKNILGMTNLLEPQIQRDFPEFNKDLLFSICENNLRKIFNCIEEKDIEKINNDDDLIYLKYSLKEEINDMKTSGIYEKFDNIVFEKHAIYSYTKLNGKASVKVCSTLSYYYDTNKKDVKCFKGVKKETRFQSDFVYVYDEKNFEQNQLNFSIRCPNCGAPLKSIEYSGCQYCGAYVERINLKAWKMVSFKEDFK